MIADRLRSPWQEPPLRPNAGGRLVVYITSPNLRGYQPVQARGFKEAVADRYAEKARRPVQEEMGDRRHLRESAVVRGEPRCLHVREAMEPGEMLTLRWPREDCFNERTSAPEACLLQQYMGRGRELGRKRVMEGMKLEKGKERWMGRGRERGKSNG